MSAPPKPRTTTQPPLPAPTEFVPPLEQGDHLTREEFERRYEAMPEVKKAELIEGVVHMPSPVRHTQHGRPHFCLLTWLGVYESATPHVQGSDNATCRLDLDNVPQPDALLFIEQACGGQSHIDADGYITNAPELVAEVSASTVSIDLHEKLRAYRRNGVREYVVWRVQDRAIDWFILRGTQYETLSAQPDGLLHSETFPGLWLDAQAMVGLNLAGVLAALQQGLASPAHQAFVVQLQQLAASP